MGAVSAQSDERLFAAYVAGDVAAHEELFRRYQEALRRYLERILIPVFVPVVPYVPFFLLPIVWGVWNWLYLRLDLRLDIGAFGSALRAMLGLGVEALFYARGTWSTPRRSCRSFSRSCISSSGASSWARSTRRWAPRRPVVARHVRQRDDARNEIEMAIDQSDLLPCFEQQVRLAHSSR